MITVLIADDHAIVRTGLSALLDAEGDIQVVGEADDGKSAVRETLRLQPDVVVMDILMPIMDGVEATRQIVDKCPSTKVLILTTSTVSDDFARAFEAGAHGAITKSSDNNKIIAAIRQVAQGRRSVSKSISALLEDDPPAPTLTPRQMEVTRFLATGLTNMEIADRLAITQDSVKEHIMSIFAKLGAVNRADAVAIALRKHLLKI